MNLRRLSARATREWVCLLLLPALAFRLVVPAGFMPTVGEDFAVTMQMCHGDASSSIVMRLTANEDSPAAPQASHDAPCVFAASATVAPPTLAPPPQRSCATPETEPPPEHAAPSARHRHHPQSPRAPPMHV
jgi:hypothetical protein